MKKYILVGTLVASMLMPMLAGATSIADLQALINSLMAQVAQLQAQLQAQQGGGTAPWCYDFKRNLGMGRIGEDVRSLQKILLMEGFTADMRNGEPLATYKEATAAAVTGFQQKYKDEILVPAGLCTAEGVCYGTGYVGPSTRRKLNQLYGCGNVIPVPPPVPASPYIAVTYPNGGETFSTNGVLPVRWNSNISGEEKVDIQLMSAGEVAYNYLNTTNDGSEDINLTSIFGTGSVSGNVYFIKVSYPSGNSSNKISDLSNAPFTISSGSTSTSTQSSITLLSPNNGETWTKGTTSMISWQDLSVPPCASGVLCYSPLKTYDIKLAPYNVPCPSGASCSTMPSMPPYIIVNGVYGSNYYWRVGNVRYMGALGNGEVTAPDGLYAVQVCSSGTGVCDSSNVPFSIVSGTSINRPPVIDGVSGPTTLNVSQQGTWTIRAHDPENSILNYQVSWGDGMYGTLPSLTPWQITQTTAQQVDFTHFYAPAGTYKITFTVSDNYGNSALSNITVNIIGGTATSTRPSITLTSPNGGERFTQGTTSTIRWTNTNYRASVVNLYLYRSNTIPGGNDYNFVQRIGELNKENNGITTWTIPSTIVPGNNYFLRIGLDVQDPQSGFDTTDDSDAPFTISSGTTTIALPDLKITSISRFSSATIQNGIKVELCNYGNATVSDSPVKIVANNITQTFSFLSVSLVSGACSSNAWDYSMWQMNPNNTYTVTATADPAGVIAESDEGNNITTAVLSGSTGPVLNSAT
ncbi:MAG: Ser-Thr-rich GPI-anchored membrane family protein, partial [bacterium]|nr:Ser-Thr-rich GPI-anchored membrane family protein [bacterium]